jgi:hypothetical protein
LLAAAGELLAAESAFALPPALSAGLHAAHSATIITISAGAQSRRFQVGFIASPSW